MTGTENTSSEQLYEFWHGTGMLLYLHQAPGPDPAWHQRARAVAVLSFRVASRADLLLWDKRLTKLGVGRSSPRQTQLGWALDVIDPSGLRIQLHIWEAINAEDT